MQKGYIQVEVNYAREAAPAEAALVQIYKANGEVIEQLTDASGLTQPVAIDAPDKELSLDPAYEGDIYATCDVLVTFDSFKTVRISEATVFAGETAVAQVFLEPLVLGTDAAADDRTTLIDIPPHKVSDNVPNDADLPPESKLRILEFVAIPSYVTVHLGKPDASAQNVTVTFLNYIKNVCCSEVYPTWPENSLRANIYCQISLVLNRIFTEWYRSKGYPFDITNSTSYDQYFVYGRNIFDNVSELVDEIFNEYIRKGSSMESYYAEYCNGTTATCPGLSQWGTVALANQGYSPLEILRYYYGSTVALYDAPLVDTNIESYPGTPLTVGSTGSYVAIIQEQLNRIRQNYPLIPSAGAVDGVFGSATEAAVKKFQSIFNLTQDGIVGKGTWYKVSYIYVAVKKLAELTSEGITSPDIIAPVPAVVLTLGSYGSYVSLAQYLLDVAADLYATLYPITVDGVFGYYTQQAALIFQNERGITADGIIGARTWNELYKVFYSVFNAVVAVGETAYPGTALKVGSTGTTVQLMQRYLNYIGGFFKSIPQLTIDGIFGNATKTAVTEFQSLFGLAADGIIGKQTWNRIIAVYDSVRIYE
ncbi:MAG: peptidoglycan-binding protein [Oscillospiraceae bacterium]|nr:peptidoglycan-binding protein [Oscillospiraceae bacterium]